MFGSQNLHRHDPTHRSENDACIAPFANFKENRSRCSRLSLHHQNHKMIAGAREKTRHVLHRLLVFVGRRELAARATEVNIATMVLISIENQQTVQYMFHFLVWSWDGHAVIPG